MRHGCFGTPPRLGSAARWGSVAVTGTARMPLAGALPPPAIAAKARPMLEDIPPRDPIDERDRSKAAARDADERRERERESSGAMLTRVARSYHERVIEPRRRRKYGADWISALERHVPASIWHRPISEIGRVELLDLLSDLQNRMADTAQRVRTRLEEVSMMRSSVA